MSGEADPAERSLNRIFADMESRGDSEGEKLLAAIKARLPELEQLLAKVSSHWHAEDGFYRFYHQSWKVYHLQEDTREIVAMLRSLAPEQALNDWFQQIVSDGTGKSSRWTTTNDGWPKPGRYWKRSSTLG